MTDDNGHQHDHHHEHVPDRQPTYSQWRRENSGTLADYEAIYGVRAPEDEDMPPEPSTTDRMAITAAEMIVAYEAQGFTHDEAFTLVKISHEAHIEAYWDHYFIEHGCASPLEGGGKCGDTA